MAIFFSFLSSALTAEDKLITVTVLGDSLIAGYGLSQQDAFPARLERHLTSSGRNVKVINAGVSGDTTAGGRARLDWVLADNPDALILVLGGNDMLRGLEPASSMNNLDDILSRLNKLNIPVLLCGMRAPANLGSDYQAEFDQIYPALAQKYDLLFYPFFLNGVALDPSLNLPDGLHPNESGIEVIVTAIAEHAGHLLDRVETAHSRP